MSKPDKPYYVSNKELYGHYLDWYAAIALALKEGKPEPDIPAPIVDAMMKISTKLSYSAEFINYSYRDELIGDAIYDCIRFARKFDPTKIIRKVELKMIEGKIEIKDVLRGETSGLTGKVKHKNPKTGIVSLQMEEERDFELNERVMNENGGIAQVVKIATHTADNPFNYITTVATNAFYRRIDAEKTQSYIKAKIITETPIHEFYDSIDPDDVELQQNFVEFMNENGSNLANNEPMALKRKRKKDEAKANDVEQHPIIELTAIEACYKEEDDE